MTFAFCAAETILIKQPKELRNVLICRFPVRRKSETGKRDSSTILREESPMNKKDSFVFYRSFKDSLVDLSEHDRLVMYEAITGYALDKDEACLEGIPKALFTLIKPQLDANFTRWENGCKGGAPKGNRNNPFGRPKKEDNKPRTNQELTKNKPNVNENENDNVNEVKKNSKKEILSFYDRQKSFHDSLIPFTDLYGKDMIRAFYDYWSEPNQAKTKMKYEMQKTWLLESRLRTWERRQNNGK
jgi:hypothetical protein